MGCAVSASVASFNSVSDLPGFTPREVQALRGAAVWYAKYHAAAVAQTAEDEAAYAVAEREEYLDLISALGKLGARVRVPDALQQAA
jgi:hypothetical protein